VVEPFDHSSYSFTDHGINNFIPFVPISEQTLYARAFPFSSDTKDHYEYVVNNVSYRLNLLAGETTQLLGRRLEIPSPYDDPWIGATYQIFWQDPSGEWRLLSPVIRGSDLQYPAIGIFDSETIPFSAPSGFDLVPGAYQVKLNYVQSDQPVEKTYECDLVSNDRIYDLDTQCTLLSQ
jgi:hypothetical protein